MKYMLGKVDFNLFMESERRENVGGNFYQYPAGLCPGEETFPVSSKDSGPFGKGVCHQDGRGSRISRFVHWEDHLQNTLGALVYLTFMLLQIQ